MMEKENKTLGTERSEKIDTLYIKKKNKSNDTTIKVMKMANPDGRDDTKAYKSRCSKFSVQMKVSRPSFFFYHR